MIGYGVTIDLQKKSFIKPDEIYPHWSKITLWKEFGCLVQKDGIGIFFLNFSNTFSNIFLDFILDMEKTLITDCMIYKIENKIESLYLQECSLKNKSFWKLFILLEASFFDVTVFI